MMAFGLLSIIVAAVSMLRQKDIKRMFAYSSIEHMGIATFAFGLGGPVATSARSSTCWCTLSPSQPYSSPRARLRR